MPQRIPRTIFLTWKMRKLGQILFTSLMTIVSHNSEYEVILFGDHDMEWFVCHQFAKSVTRYSISPYLYSKLIAGAARADVFCIMLFIPMEASIWTLI
jgi:mannosyltransferase OCH1-like enzyme